MPINKAPILILLACLSGCATLTGSEPTPAAAINLSDATNMAADYLADKKIQWGEPTSIENVFGKYVFIFSTPESELKSLGNRKLIIDTYTGEISFPLRF